MTKGDEFDHYDRQHGVGQLFARFETFSELMLGWNWKIASITT
jgi:hypothetical protein